MAESRTADMPTDNQAIDESLPQIVLKIVVLGDTSVGKTCIVERFVEGTFSDSVTSTVGASFATKRIALPSCSVKLQLWDTAGQERFQSLAPMYYRNSKAAVLVFDVCSMKSFHKVEFWINELKAHTREDILVAVAGNKIDLGEKREVSRRQLYDYGKKHNVKCFEVSAKTGEGIEDIFIHLTTQLIEAKANELPVEAEFTNKSDVYQIDFNADKKKADGCCS